MHSCFEFNATMCLNLIGKSPKYLHKFCPSVNMRLMNDDNSEVA